MSNVIGIGGDNVLAVRHHGSRGWMLTEEDRNGFVFYGYSFFTREAAVYRANRILAEEQLYSGIEHERFSY